MSSRIAIFSLKHSLHDLVPKVRTQERGVALPDGFDFDSDVLGHFLRYS